MKHTFLLTLFSLAIVALMTACSSKTSYVDADTRDNTEACIAIDKKLVKVDRFLSIVHNTSAFHLEEYAATIPIPGITESSNKPRMLKDVNRKKAALLDEHQKLGCETPAK